MVNRFQQNLLVMSIWKVGAGQKYLATLVSLIIFFFKSFIFLKGLYLCNIFKYKMHVIFNFQYEYSSIIMLSYLKARNQV